jgi:hypothetical protein
MPPATVSPVTERLAALAAKLGMTTRQLRSAKVTAMTDAQRAKLLGVTASTLGLVRTPIVLAPAAPIKGASRLTIFTALMVDPTWPAGSGQALFSSAYPGAVDSGVQVAFPRIKKGRLHLVEFYVSLPTSVAYKFRVFTYPLGEFQDVTIQGPKASTVIPALVPPVDEIDGTPELGAAIQLRNTKADGAGWGFQSAQVNATG